MRTYTALILIVLLILGCSSNVKFIPKDESYVAVEKPGDAKIVFKQGRIQRPHKVIGIIEANLGRDARKMDLNKLMIEKAREVGADGIMLVEYDIDRDVYMERHHTVVGRGPWRRHVVRSRPRASVEKTAAGVAVVFR